MRINYGMALGVDFSKWPTIAKCSSDTAVRDINDLVDRGILIKALLAVEVQVSACR